MRTVARSLHIAVLLSVLLAGLGARETGSEGGGRRGGGRRPATLCRPVHEQRTKVPAGRRSGLTAVAASRPAAASRSSFVGAAGGGGRGGGSMHARRMLNVHVWRALSATRILAKPRPVAGLTPLQAVRGSGGAKRSSSSSAVAAERAEKASSKASDAAAKAAAAAAGTAGRGTAADAGKRDVSVGGVCSEPHVYAESLAFLSSPPEKALKGVGPVRAEQLAKLGIRSVANLLWHLPTGIVDRRQVSRVADLVEGEIATVLLKVTKVSSYGPGRASKMTRVECVDVDGSKMDIIIFGRSGWSASREYELGKTKVVSGRVTADKFSKNLVISPEIAAPLADLDKVMVVQPTYPLTTGLKLSGLRSAITVALETLEDMPFPPEWIDHKLVRENGWPSAREALIAAHNPQQEGDLELSGAIRSRLAYDEILASQVVLALRRRQTRGAERTNDAPHDSGGVRLEGKGGGGDDPAATSAVGAVGGDLSTGFGQASSVEAARARGAALVEEGRRLLPFELTRSQNKALNEILGDMNGSGKCSSLRMFRLLQGDVGSGKTAVAFLAMLNAAGQGSQVCMLAPTEVLTVQHLQTLRSMAEGIQRPDGTGPLRVELLTGNIKGKARQALLDCVKAGEVDILVATHAVLASASTAFQDLGLAVVDEEQRFGVEQRDKLTGFAQHVLYLSATPIPRSLTLAVYGDMEVSQIREMPQGAADIVTTLIPVARAKEIVDRLKDQQDTSNKVFWVLPQINKSESGARQYLASATERYEALVEELGEDRVSLLHGKMTSAEKSKTLSEFSETDEGEGLRVLVSTSIIEVGVDVPQAGVCVVENAEMFGLSQLHQLRGRLGRTDRGKKGQTPTTADEAKKQNSHCILLYGPNISNDATERLKAIRATRDGFLLAERDLTLRGPGEVLGVRQKGYVEGKFKVADLARHGSLAEHANTRARGLVDSWAVRGAVVDGGDDEGSLMSAGAGAEEAGREKDGSIAAARGAGEIGGGGDGLGGGGGEMERGHPQTLGLLLTLCGLDADAEVLLAGFVSPAPSRGGGGAAAAAAAAAGDVAAGGVTDAAGAGRSREAVLASSEHGGAEVGKEGEGNKGRDFEQNGSLPSSSASLSAATEYSTAGSADTLTTPAADTLPEEYSTSGYGIGTGAAAPGAAAVVEADDVSKLAKRREQEEEEERGLERQQRPAVPAAVYFDDEADFLEKPALEYAVLMAGQDEEEDYLSGFSFAPPSFTAARAPPPVDGGRGAARMSEGDRFRQVQEQRRGQLVERRGRNYNEESLPPPPGGGGAGAGWPPLQPTAAAGGQREQERRVVVAPAETAAAGGGGSSREPSPPLGAAGAEEACIIRRANLLEGGQTIVLVDVETTGLSPKTDRIIQLAGKVLGSEDPKHVFSTYVDPEMPLKDKIQEMTGITPQVLAANNARIFREIWPEFAAWLSEVGQGEGGAGGSGGAGGVALVAHNAKFDHDFLVEEQDRSGFDRFMMGQDLGVVAIVDSLKVLKEQSMWKQGESDLDMPIRPGTFKLGVLFKHLYGSEMPGAHTALGDVRGLESVLSAPGISERWRGIASDHPTCQIPVPRSVAELQAAMQMTPPSRRGATKKKTSARGGRNMSTSARGKNYSSSNMWYSDNNGGGRNLGR